MVKKTVPPTRFPDAVAVSYSREIKKLVNAMGKETLTVFDELIKNEIINYNRSDNSEYIVDGPFDFIKNALNKVLSAAADIFSTRKMTNVTRSFMKNLNQFNKKNMEQQGKVMGIDPTQSEPWLKPFMQEAVENNVSYITNIRDDYTKKIENIVLEGAKNGAAPNTIRNQLVEQVGMTKRRAKFVAVDQTGSLFGQMTAKRHQQMGVTKFTWRTSKDERVRDTHRILENKVYSYEKPPKVGLPGEDFRCRCIAIPVFDDDEEEIAVVEEENEAAVLTDDETRAINQYISSDSYKINEKLRSNSPLNKEDKLLVKNLDAALEKLPNFTGDLNRSLFFYNDESLADFVTQHDIGEVIPTLAYMSTSKDVYDSDDDIRLIIKNSRNAKDLKGYNDGEQEVLYKRDSRFIVIDKYLLEGKVYIVLEEYNE